MNGPARARLAVRNSFLKILNISAGCGVARGLDNVSLYKLGKIAGAPTAMTPKRFAISCAALFFAVLIFVNSIGEKESEEAAANQMVLEEALVDFEWPFTVKAISVVCVSDYEAIFVEHLVTKERFAINGLGQQFYPDLEPDNPLWRDDPKISGLKVSVSPVIQKGLGVC